MVSVSSKAESLCEAGLNEVRVVFHSDSDASPKKSSQLSGIMNSNKPVKVPSSFSYRNIWILPVKIHSELLFLLIIPEIKCLINFNHTAERKADFFFKFKSLTVAEA